LTFVDVDGICKIPRLVPRAISLGRRQTALGVEVLIR
jgi:hypothetical protein